MSIPEERQFSLAEAESRVMADLLELNLTQQTYVMGAGPCAVWTELYDVAGTFKTGGWGKGDLQAARVGALYESLEHLTTHHDASSGAVARPVTDVLASLPENEASALPGLLLADQRESAIACRSYRDLAGGAAFDYPVALSSPDYPDAPLPSDTFGYNALRRYSSNSGTAIGASLEEATLHALNESIERDAISLFLLTHFFHAGDAPLHVLGVDGLPDDVAALHRKAAVLLDADICLLDISTGFGVTTCIALAHREDPVPRPFGAGASLNPAHAARRAITELLQCCLGQECSSAAIQPPAGSAADPSLALTPWPRLLASLTLDIEARLFSQQVVSSRIEERPQGTIAEQIASIVDQLSRHSLRAGINVLRTTSIGTTVVNVVVPGLERFYLVSTGNVVAPGARGCALAGSR